MALTRFGDINPFRELQQPVLHLKPPGKLRLVELNETLSDPILRGEKEFQKTAQLVLNADPKLVAEYDDNSLICWVGRPKPQKHVSRSSVTEETCS